MGARGRQRVLVVGDVAVSAVVVAAAGVALAIVAAATEAVAAVRRAYLLVGRVASVRTALRLDAVAQVGKTLALAAPAAPAAPAAAAVLVAVALVVAQRVQDT